MKNITKYLYTFFLVLIAHAFLYAQDFTVKVKSTEKYDNYLKPLKAGSIDTLIIRVTNNTSETYDVILSQFDMRTPVSNWVTIDTAEYEIDSSKSQNFTVKIDVPTGTNEDIYYMELKFNAYDESNTYHSFEYETHYE